jgi:ABC-type bacteriocin/lantibiotic exporter with double-glycine peptidase domain
MEFDIIQQLLYKFFKEEYFKTIILLIICIIVNVVQTNGISKITAKIINSIKQTNLSHTQYLVWWFIALSVIYLIFNHLFKVYQNQLMTKMRQWIRNKLIKILLRSNNENFSETNFLKYETPINRISSICFMISSDILTFILPTIIFMFIISIYFLYHNTILGTTFLLTNIIIFIYLRYNWDNMMNKNNIYEKNVTNNEIYLLEILNNMDKIVYRGQINEEYNIFEALSKKTIQTAYEFYDYVNDNNTIVTSIVYASMFFFISYSIYLFKHGKLNMEIFITLFSIIILYREKMAVFSVQIPDFVEFIGRTNSVLQFFDNINIEEFLNDKKYNDIDLPFETIEFKDVSFKYKSHDFKVFDNFQIKLNTTNHKIIGITGLSGRGKSSFAKLILKMYECDGDILIDGVNVREIDANYIRKNITYVNQNSKLFDRLIIDNMMYGCIEEDVCSQKIEEIIQNYPKIKDLFKNIDIYKKKSGPLGEHLSGGQRQVVNIVGGLANPSKILILDEPTNALDSSLKSELLRLIYEHRNSKQCIIIITHDKDVYSIFNEKINI